MDTGERGELWRKALIMLRTININQEKFAEMEGLVNRIKTDLAESMRLGGNQYTNNTYERQYLVAQLQSTLEDFRKEAKELEELEKKLQATYHSIETDSKIHDQIREQLKKNLKIVTKESR